MQETLVQFHSWEDLLEERQVTHSSVLGLPWWLSSESAYNVGDPGLIPGLGRFPGEGNGCPLQYSGLDNSMNCIVHGVAKDQTRLSNFHFTHDEE